MAPDCWHPCQHSDIEPDWIVAPDCWHLWLVSIEPYWLDCGLWFLTSIGSLHLTVPIQLWSLTVDILSMVSQILNLTDWIVAPDCWHPWQQLHIEPDWIVAPDCWHPCQQSDIEPYWLNCGPWLLTSMSTVSIEPYWLNCGPWLLTSMSTDIEPYWLNCGPWLLTSTAHWTVNLSDSIVASGCYSLDICRAVLLVLLLSLIGCLRRCRCRPDWDPISVCWLHRGHETGWVLQLHSQVSAPLASLQVSLQLTQGSFLFALMQS